MKRIRVLHCITDLSPDGAQRALLRLASRMNKDKFENQIVSLMRPGPLLAQFEAQGLKVKCLNLRGRLSAALHLLSLVKVIRDYQPQIIQGWMYHGNLAAAVGKLLALSEAPLIWNIRRCLYEQPGEKRLTRAVVKLGGQLSWLSRKIIYCVDVSASQHEAIGYNADKRWVIPNGFDTRRFLPSSSAAQALRAELSIAESERIVGIVGRYHAQKDYPTFLKAARLVLNRSSNVRFIMIGRGLSTDNSELVEMIREAGLNRSVCLLGERQDVAQLIAGFDIFCSSSANEGFANVVGEAMSCQIPCVVTDAGASRELVEGLGVVVKRYDPQGLCEGLIRMLSLDKAELVRRGISSRKKIVQSYSLEIMIRGYESLYETESGAVLDEQPETLCHKAPYSYAERTDCLVKK